MSEHFDLVIIGSGSGNSLIPEHPSGRIAIIEAGVFGGTCLNRGCIPTKMFVYTADVAEDIAGAGHYDLDAEFLGADWPAIRDRIFSRIDPISAGGREYRRESDVVTLIEGEARFTGPLTLEVEGWGELTGERIVIAVGARPEIPEVFSGVSYHTSDTVMRIDNLPRHALVIGGGYISAELAHVFSSLGSEVSVVNRSGRLLRALDPSISERFTELAAKRWDVHLGAQVTEAAEADGEYTLRLDTGELLKGDLLLVATGRIPNGDRLNLPAGGVETHRDGRVVVDRYGRTTAPGVWALGDVSSPFQLKHVANAEARAVSHNLEHPYDLRPMAHDAVPSAVFTWPQIASVGARRQELGDDGFVEVTHDYGDVAYGWALRDQTSFCRLYGDPSTRRLLGAHIIGPQASILIQPLVQAMSFDQDPLEVARGQYWIHPALTEVVENALLKLDAAFNAA